MGGAEYQSHLVAQELASRPGTQVHFIARGVPATGAYGAPPYEVVSVGQARGLARRSLTADAPRLIKLLREIRPDVIYQRMRVSYTGLCQSYAAAARIPLFVHVASDFDLDPRLLRPGRLSLNLPFELLDAAIGNWGLRRAARIVLQTDRQAALLRAGYGRNSALVVRNCQPLPDQLHARDNSPLRVLWIGNLRPIKRPELFLELARRLSHIGSVEFLLAGRTYDGRYSEILSRRDLPPNFRYLGPLPHDDVLDLLSRSHMLVNTSQMEGSPNTFIEAWGRGVVVASLDVDVDDALKGRGIGVHAGDVDTLAAEVERLLGDTEMRLRMATRAFNYVHKTHSMSNIVRLCDAIIDSVRAVGR
jgi:glycosyltransferase involved in cell wall biosynthesis